MVMIEWCWYKVKTIIYSECPEVDRIDRVNTKTCTLMLNTKHAERELDERKSMVVIIDNI